MMPTQQSRHDAHLRTIPDRMVGCRTITIGCGHASRGRWITFIGPSKGSGPGLLGRIVFIFGFVFGFERVSAALGPQKPVRNQTETLPSSRLRRLRVPKSAAPLKQTLQPVLVFRFIGPGPGSSGGPREAPQGPPWAFPGASDLAQTKSLET